MLPKIIIFQLPLTRNRILAGATSLLLAVYAGNLGCETLTLTTYYPPPYAVYSKLRVTEHIKAGTAGSEIIVGRLDDYSGDLIAPGGSGSPPETGTEGAGDYKYTGVYSLGTDLVLGSLNGGAVKLGDQTYLGRMCKFGSYSGFPIRYLNNPGCDSGYIALAVLENNEEMGMSYVHIGTTSGYGFDVWVSTFSSSGKLLCCKLGMI